MSNIQYTDPLDPRHKKRRGSVYQSGVQLFMQHRRVNPRDEKTALQQFNRNIVEYVSRMWKDLTAPEKATWTPCPGETLTGYYLYMSVNIIDMEAGAAFQRIHVCPHVKLFEQPYFVNEFE